MRFRPCIDLHEGKVKQIVGGTLERAAAGLRTNYTAPQPPAYFAELYRRDGLAGGHIIMLGPGNEAAAREALHAWPGGLQIGGGITAENAAAWLREGAAAVIVTSSVFREGQVDYERLETLVKSVGRENLVLDLSCRRRESDYYIMTDRWSRFTNVALNPRSLQELSGYCAEFLVHGVDVEGLCSGIEEELVELLGQYSPIPATYAGGIRSMEDVHRVQELGLDRVDFTVGSALDLFGGTGVRYGDLVSGSGG